MQQHWDIRESEVGTFLSLSGDWDLDRINEFSNFVNTQLEDASVKNFIVDLKEVTYIDSMALGVLINLHRLYQQRGGRLYLLRPRQAVEKILKYSGVDKVFAIFDSEEDLKAELNKPPSGEE